MNRIFDFQREDPGEVVSRIAMAVHKAVDEHFPHIANPSQKFSKTSFTAEDTALNLQVRSSVDTQQRVSAEVPVVGQQIELSHSVTKPTAKVEPRPEISDLPVSEFGELQYSRVEKTALQTKKPGVLRRLLIVTLVTALLTVVAAYWVHTLLVGSNP